MYIVAPICTIQQINRIFKDFFVGFWQNYGEKEDSIGSWA